MFHIALNRWCPWAQLDSQPQAVRPHNCVVARCASAQGWGISCAFRGCHPRAAGDSPHIMKGGQGGEQGKLRSWFPATAEEQTISGGANGSWQPPQFIFVFHLIKGTVPCPLGRRGKALRATPTSAASKTPDARCRRECLQKIGLCGGRVRQAQSVSDFL